MKIWYFKPLLVYTPANNFLHFNFMPLPILYSFRRCPYAMRARIALASNNITVEIREVVLKDKPNELIELSPKATVPVLLLKNGNILEESLDIMSWASSTNSVVTKSAWLNQNLLSNDLIRENDTIFKQHLDKYKYADRFPGHDPCFYRKQGEEFLNTLNSRLSEQAHLYGEQISLIDYAIFPFIRQFAHVDKDWFDHSEYNKVKSWLNNVLESDLFLSTMKKYPKWKRDDEQTRFP